MGLTIWEAPRDPSGARLQMRLSAASGDTSHCAGGATDLSAAAHASGSARMMVGSPSRTVAGRSPGAAVANSRKSPTLMTPTVSYHMTHHVVNFCSVLPCMGLWLPALSCLCVLSQALMGYQPSGCFLLLCLA